MRHPPISHFLVRLVAAAGILDFALAELYPPYFRTILGGPVGRIVTICSTASALILPIYIGSEAWRVRRTDADWKALRIDAVFVAAWLLVFVGGFLYALGHAVPF